MSISRNKWCLHSGYVKLAEMTRGSLTFGNWKSGKVAAVSVDKSPTWCNCSFMISISYTMLDIFWSFRIPSVFGNFYPTIYTIEALLDSLVIFCFIQLVCKSTQINVLLLGTNNEKKEKKRKKKKLC